MANTKKPKEEKKKIMSFSIKTKHFDVFKDICFNNKLIASNEIEKLIIQFNKKIKK